MSIIRNLQKLSLVQTVLLALFIAIVLAVPMTIFFTRQQTEQVKRQLSQQFSKPVEFPEKQDQSIGLIPDQPPKIGRVFPWVGKIGDVVWIQGEHFGDNPPEKTLTIGNVVLPDAKIISWLDTEIQAIIPIAAVQGGVVSIDNGSHQVAESLQYVLYDQSDQKNGIKLRKDSNIITVERPRDAVKAVIWYGDENTETTSEEIDITSNEIDTQGRPILTILLYDENGNVLPYYVNPSEFGF